MNSNKELDIKLIRRCFKLARRGVGKVSPNPLVGAIVVKNGKVIGEGWHKMYGAPHAEVKAIFNAKDDVSGSTLYCNLEPCCHTKKQTPPCVPLIIDKRIKRVVISNLDPNKEVNGKGVKQLKKACIEVTTGILKNEGKELNKFYFKHIQEEIPYTTIKIAQSLDGKISKTGNKQIWLTGKQSIKFVHNLRREYDAVLVGANTIKVDNPQLTVRNISGRNPVRIILDGKLSIPLKSNVIECKDPHNTWIFTSENSSERKEKILLKKGIRIFRLNSLKNNFVSLKKILKILSEHKILSILVEGGADIFNRFIQAKMFDEIIVLQAPKMLNKGINAPNIDILNSLSLISTGKLGNDTKLIYGRNLSD